MDWKWAFKPMFPTKSAIGFVFKRCMFPILPVNVPWFWVLLLHWCIYGYLSSILCCYGYRGSCLCQCCPPCMDNRHSSGTTSGAVPSTWCSPGRCPLSGLINKSKTSVNILHCLNNQHIPCLNLILKTESFFIKV